MQVRWGCRGVCVARATWALVPLLAVVLASCSSATKPDDDGDGRNAAVIQTIIRSMALEEPPGDDPDVLPIVYVVGADDFSIPISVQAEVASAFVDEADIRFADGRGEAIDEGSDGEPVRDGGVLLAVGPIPRDAPRAVDVAVERYASLDDQHDAVVSLRWDDSDWVVSSTVVVPEPIG